VSNAQGEACDLRWDDVDLTKRTITLRRLKGSNDSRHYLERDELAGLKALQRSYAAKGIRSVYVFVNERGQPFGRMGIARMVERGGEIANLPFPVHVHMLRHSTGYALAAKGMDTRRLQHFLGHASITNTVRYTAMSPEPFKDVWQSTPLSMDRTSVWCLPHRLLLDERKLRPRFVYLDIMAMLLSKAAPPAAALRQ